LSWLMKVTADHAPLKSCSSIGLDNYNVITTYLVSSDVQNKESGNMCMFSFFGFKSLLLYAYVTD
jgi:hypothetical protein